MLKLFLREGRRSAEARWDRQSLDASQSVRWVKVGTVSPGEVNGDCGEPDEGEVRSESESELCGFKFSNLKRPIDMCPYEFKELQEARLFQTSVTNVHPKVIMRSWD